MAEVGSSGLVDHDVGTKAGEKTSSDGRDGAAASASSLPCAADTNGYRTEDMEMTQATDEKAEDYVGHVHHTSEAFQSLRQSLLLQETIFTQEMPIGKDQNEGQIKAKAQKQLEEQLHQYRVKQRTGRLTKTSPKQRQISTLDPDLMLNPDSLPRVQTVTMTKEYSYIRTTVPRGPKVGSLGIPVNTTDMKVKKNKVHSLSDYKSAADNNEYSLKDVGNSYNASFGSGTMNSSTSAISLVTNAPATELNYNLEVRSPDGNATTEVNRVGVEDHAITEHRTPEHQTSETVKMEEREGSSVGHEMDLGQYATLHDVLTSAAEHLMEMKLDDSEHNDTEQLSLSASSSVTNLTVENDEVSEILREKTQLEGQLEALASEAKQAMKEKTEVQATLAALEAERRAEQAQAALGESKCSEMGQEVLTLKQKCLGLEQAMLCMQTNLELKNSGLKNLSNDLGAAEQQYQRLLGRLEDLQKTVADKDNSVHMLRQNMSSMQRQLQQVQVERSALASQLTISQGEIATLMQARDWYQQQLSLAQKSRVQLQSELISIQAGNANQTGLMEQLKLENLALAQQLSESQQKSLKEKEQIALHLQTIEADLLDQEKTVQHIEQAKALVEQDLAQRVEKFEDERLQLIKMADCATHLQKEMDKLRLTVHQKDLQLQALEQEHVSIMEQLSSSQEALHAREHAMHVLQAQYDLLGSQLVDLQAEINVKDDNIEFLQNTKLVLEVELQAARAEHQAVGEGLGQLEDCANTTTQDLQELRQQLTVKGAQIETIQEENKKLLKQVHKVKDQLTQQKVMVEAYRRDATAKEQLLKELKTAKHKLDVEVRGLRGELLSFKAERETWVKEQDHLNNELRQLREHLAAMEDEVLRASRERSRVEGQLQSLQSELSSMSSTSQENEELKTQLDHLQREARKAITEQKNCMKKIGTDLSSAQKDLKLKHKAYEHAVSILSRKLQEALSAKETAELELNKLQANVAASNTHPTAEHVESLKSELCAVVERKEMLEKELQEVIASTSRDLEQSRTKMLDMEGELEKLHGANRRVRSLEQLNRRLALELEHERGRLAGTMRSHVALKEHAAMLQAAVATREAHLRQLSLQVQAVLRQKEEEDCRMKQIVQSLQTSLDKEQENVADLKHLVSSTKCEAADNRRHFKAASLELAELKKELATKQGMMSNMQEELEELRLKEASREREVTELLEELAEVRTEVKTLQIRLRDETRQLPDTQTLEDVKWQCEQKDVEIQTLRQQLTGVEHRSRMETESAQAATQEARSETELLREALAQTRKEKFVAAARVRQLQSSMKVVLQQNEQLKLDLQQMQQPLSLSRAAGVASTFPGSGKSLHIPQCPVPAALLEELLRPPNPAPAQPLANLQNCLQKLRFEMETLQQQMEEHTVAVHESVSSWTELEGQLKDLSTADGSTPALVEEQSVD